jgi:hypothetical protein
MKKLTTLLSVLVLCAGMLLPTPAEAIWPWKKKKTTEVAADTAQVSKNPRYDKLFKGKKYETARGMITLHKVNGKLYFELPVQLLGREMLIGSTVSEISNSNDAIIGSKPQAPLHVCFTKTDSLVQLRAINSDYVVTDSHIDRAVKQSSIGAILKNMKIEAYNNDSTAVVFEITDFFLGDNKKMTPFSPFAANAGYERSETYKNELSYLTQIKAFSDNVVIKSCLSYVYTLTNYTSGATVVKDRPFTVVMTRSIVLLPEKPYRPRMADYRIGVFFTERMQLGMNAATSAPVYFANRWNLAPSDTAAYRRGEKVEPVTPIVFYIDNAFPEAWKPAIFEGVNQWQELFEEIGFKNAIRAKPFPVDDPEFDPDNIKYSCVRYAPVNIQNAMGPSWVDPRSGEIFTASVYVYHDVLKMINNWLFLQTSPADADVRNPKVPEEKLFDGLRYVIAHEIGHCLGFMHNMSASAVIPVDSLRSPSYTAQHGTTTSIMDYARFNYVAQPGDKERGVKLTPPRFGEYDRYLIKWTYTPVFDAASAEEEAAITTAWISEAIKNPVYRYGKQQIYLVIDPRSQVEDLGDDAVAASKYGIKNLKYIMANFDQWIIEGDEDFTFRTTMLMEIINQYARYCAHVYHVVGGLYMNEVKTGDDLPHYENVPAAKQIEALNYLFELYGDQDWLDNKAYLRKLPLLGSPKNAVENYLSKLIVRIPFRVANFSDVSWKSFSFRESADKVYDFVWKSTLQGRVPTKSEMLLQRQYVTQMMEAGGFQMPSNKQTITLAIHHDHHGACLCGTCHDENELHGKFVYSPVAGFEWVPRAIFNIGQITVADMYAYLVKAKRLLAGKALAAQGQVKAHYELLLKQIELGVK